MKSILSWNKIASLFLLGLIQVACNDSVSEVKESIAPAMAETATGSGEASEAPHPSPKPSELPVADAGNDDPRLIESVIQQHSAAKERVHSLYVELTWRDRRTWPEIPNPNLVLPSGRMTEEGTSKTWQKEGKFHQDFTRHRVWHDSGATTEERFIYVLADTYCIEYHEVPKILMVYRFDDRNSMYQPVLAHSMAFPYPDILDFGFSLPAGSVQDMYDSWMEYHPGYSDWSIERETSDEEDQFRISRIADVRGESYLADELVVAADRGFLIPEYRAYNRQGELERSMHCELRSRGDSKWYPKTIKYFDAGADSELEIDVKRIAINEEVDDRVFTLEKMNIDPQNVVLHEYTPEGRSKTEKALWNGQWLPISMIPRSERPQPPDPVVVSQQVGQKKRR